jgi:predicted Holliday junction resolvase-like endonuclease
MLTNIALIIIIILMILYIFKLHNNLTNNKKEIPNQDNLENIAELRQSLALIELEQTYTRQELNTKSEMVDTYIDKIEELMIEVKHQKGRAASQATLKGQALEKWAPFLEHENIEPDWKIENWSFMGSPIDYIVWHYSTNKEDNLKEGRVVFLDVKAGKSSLTTKQRRIRELIQAGRVEWRTIRLD